ncbi:DUF1877 family protein [Bacillus sp. P14.5]|uniref:DUF1877 family protein n=1 Tax=Bacillus sp. P14.5 TaxID=1983400 RepID=UPI000DE91702|nr:DUF1877 family protein [Bacillus sp. P14.5]
MGLVGAYMRVSEDELAGVLLDSNQVEELLDDEERQTDIDKAWHGLYFLLTGETDLDAIDRHSLGKAVFGGDVIDEETGMAYLTSAEVYDLAERLHFIELSALEARYDAATMNEQELYPFENGWGPEKNCICSNSSTS